MKLKDFLDEISFISKKHSLSEPFIVGGAPRDKILNKINLLSDIDITTGNSDIFILAKEVGKYFASYLDFFKIMNDGHAALKVKGIKIDFSNNFKIKNISDILSNKNIKNDNMYQEIYSRDFKCNTLLWSLNLDNIFDLTNQGMVDIKNKIIDTCLAPEITLSSDPKRIIRAIYLSSKLNFTISNNVKNWIKENSNHLRLIDNGYITKKIIKSSKYNLYNTISLIKELGILKNIPYSPEVAFLFRDL